MLKSCSGVWDRGRKGGPNTSHREKWHKAPKPNWLPPPHADVETAVDKQRCVLLTNQPTQQPEPGNNVVLLPSPELRRTQRVGEQWILVTVWKGCSVAQALLARMSLLFALLQGAWSFGELWSSQICALHFVQGQYSRTGLVGFKVKLYCWQQLWDSLGMIWGYSGCLFIGTFFFLLKKKKPM